MTQSEASSKPAAGSASARLLHSDLLKIGASNLIVLHHFAIYGPISDALASAAPGLVSWMYDYARMAVQVFLVMGGYFAARALSPQGAGFTGVPTNVVLQRFRRLVLPYLAALMLTMLVSWLVRLGMSSDAIPQAPTVAQVVAHLFLMQGLLGYDSLSAGVWYIAIDFQLFVLLTLLLWASTRIKLAFDVKRAAWIAKALVLACLLMGLFYFNRDARWDNWALYFFAAYGLGVLTYWGTHSRYPKLQLALLAAVVIAGLIVDFRARLVVALITALVLGLMARRGTPLQLPENLARWVSKLGRESYALFLVHFSVCLLANLVFVRMGYSSPIVAAVLLGLGWAVSLVVAQYFYQHIERRMV